MRRKGRPKKQKSGKNAGRRPGRPRKRANHYDEEAPKPSVSRKTQRERDPEEALVPKKEKGVVSTTVLVVDDGMSEGLHVTTSQVHALGALVSCRECGESVRIGVRPTTKGMISEFTVACNVCEDTKSTNTPNLVRERKRKREKKDAVLQKTENINYAHVAAFLDNGLGYSGLRHYCKYFNARCLNEATFIVYARQVISDVVGDTEESLQYSASIVREVFKSQLETDGLVDLTVAFTTTYHQWGSDFCLVAGAVIELTTGLVLDYDVANMYCHVCKINAKKIVSMSPAEMTEWFNKHQDTCEIREWCDELDHDAEEGVREIEPKYLECFIAKKIWSRSIDKFGFRYTTLIHESDEKIHEELSRAGVYGDVPILIDSATSCFSRRKSEHARTSFQTKLKAKCPRERVQTKDRIMYVYSMSIPEYNKFAISSNIKLRQLVKEMEGGEAEEVPAIMEEEEGEEQMPNALQLHEVKAIKRLVANGEEEEEEEEEEERVEREILFVEEEVNREEQEVDDPEELEEEEGMEQDDEDLLEEEEALAAQNAEEEERRKLEAEWGEEDEEEEEEEAMQQLTEEGEVERRIEEIHLPLHIKEESKSHFKEENKSHIKEEVLGLAHQLDEDKEDEEEEEEEEEGDEEIEQLEGNEEEEEEEEEELEQLRLEDEDEQMEDREEEEELQVEEQIQEEEEEKEEEEVPPQPQPTSKQIKKQEDDKTKTQEKSKVVPANQRSQMGELRQIRKEEIKKNQQEEISKKRKQEDMEEEQDIVVKRSKQEEIKQNSKEASKQGETKQKESERGQREKEEEKKADSKEERSKEQDKAKVNDKQKQKEDKPKEKEQQKSDSQQAAKREEKQKADTKPSEKKEDKQKTDTKQTENKESRQKTDTKPSDKRDDRQKPDTKLSEKKEEKKVTETKAQEKEETKEKGKDTTKQREEESNPRTEVKQKGDMHQQEKAEASKQPSKRPGEGEGKAADTRPKVTSNATVTE